MTRVALLLCLTILALTQAAPDPSKRIEDQQDQRDQESQPEQPQQPVANYFAGPEGPQMDQQFMAPPMDQQMAPQTAPQMDQQMAPPPADQPVAPPMDQQIAPPADQQAGSPQMDQPTDQQMDCCPPGPSCFNPCPPAAAPISFMPPPPPPPPVAACCQPGPTCTNPCAVPPPMPDMGMAGCCDPSIMPTCQNPCQPPHPPRTAYAPYPGEITMKLKQPWKSELVDHTSPAYQILAGNLATAVKTALRREAYISNIYFREGYVPGNPSTQPITVAHYMVDGGSDDASVLQQSVTPDESLGDGLKVYKDSFNAY